MFEDIFASYNKVSPPDTYVDFSVEVPEQEDIPEFNPVAQTYVDSMPDLSEKTERPTAKKKSSTKKQTTRKQTTQTLTGSADFESAFQQALKIDPSIAQYKNWLTKTAKMESSFRSSIKNPNSPYYGYFQMGEKEIKATTGLSVEQFRNNPVQQILGAVKLYQMKIKDIKNLGIYDLCKSKGFSDDAMAAGAWLGGAGGVKKFIQGSSDPSDSHWYGGKGGTTVGTRMKQFNS